MNTTTILCSAAAIVVTLALGAPAFAQTSPNAKPAAGSNYNQMKKDRRQAGIGPASKNGMRQGTGPATMMALPKSPAIQGGSYSQMKRDKYKAGLGPQKNAVAQVRSSMQKDPKSPTATWRDIAVP
jgi:hypothetical protein